MLILHNCHTVQAYTEGPFLPKDMYFPTVNCQTNRSWNSTWFGNRLEVQGIMLQFLARTEISLCSKAPRLALELTQPLIHWAQRPPSTGVKLIRQDTDHISP
jgi:hypothetical protein